jgi:hypothetical protein
MTNAKSLSFSIRIVKIKAVNVWNNPKCHDCIYEFYDLCKTFGVHSPSDDLHCLFCINNPNAVLPKDNHYKTMEELMPLSQK